MPVTPVYGLPYPALSDPPNGPAQFQALAEAVEAKFVTLDATDASLGSRVTTLETTVVNVPVAMLRQTAAQSIPNNTFTALTFDVEDFDTANGHSTSVNTSRYTAQRAGKYQLSGGVGFAVNASGSRGSYWAKNGIAINGSQILITNNGGVLNSFGSARTIQVQLAVNDYVELHAYQNSGGPLNTLGGGAASDNASMTILYVGA